MNLVERDYAIMRELERWRFCLGRHIKVLAGFNGVRACDRRLSKLIEAGYIERKKVLYGVPSLYMLTHKGKKLIGAVARVEKIRVEQITHDITVLDTAIYFIKSYKVKSETIVTEKDLHKSDGFGVRKHQPDLVIHDKGKTFCIEVELTLKASAKVVKNIENNYLIYDSQIWIVPKTQHKIRELITANKDRYTNISIIDVEKIQEFMKDV